MIAFTKVGKSFNGKAVFDGLSFAIKEGEKKLIYGESGTGKTTVLNMILGFEKPDTGTIEYRSNSLTDETIKTIRKDIALLPQNLDIAEGNVFNFVSGVFSLKSTPDLQMEKLYDLLNEWQLDEDILEKDFGQISGGEKQRLAIIIALLLERNVYLLDEPTSSLDEKLKLRVRDKFLNMNGSTLIVVSHDDIWYKSGIDIIDLERK